MNSQFIMDVFTETQYQEGISLESQNVLSYCITAFESYESLLREFGDPNGFIDHEIILEKIRECSRAIGQLLVLYQGSYIETLLRLQNSLNEFFDDILKRKRLDDSKKPSSTANSNHNPQSKQSFIAVENTVEKPRVNGLNDIAGLWEAKRILKMLVLLPKQQPQLFENRKQCNRLLLFGPPGTGKTLLAHAVAAEMKAVFYSVSASDILSPLVGESEKMVKALFQHAKETKEYSIIFIDEIDGFCRKRNSSEQEHSRRLKTEIMCQISSIEDCKHIFFICATNCPWDLDSAILRRFQKHIFISLPDRTERLDLLKFYTSKTPVCLQDSPDCDELLNITEGLSSSDLAILAENAMDIPILQLQDNTLWKKSIDDFYEPAGTEDDYRNIFLKNIDELPHKSVRARPMTIADLIVEAKNYKPTVSEDYMQKYNIFNKK